MMLKSKTTILIVTVGMADLAQAQSRDATGMANLAESESNTYELIPRQQAEEIVRH